MMKKLCILFLMCLTIFSFQANISYAENWKTLKTLSDRTIMLDTDSVQHLQINDGTFTDKNAFMFWGKVVFSDNSKMVTKSNIKESLMYFNVFTNNWNQKNYRLTQTKYLDKNKSIIKTFGKTNWNLVKEDSVGALFYDAVIQLSLEK